MRTVLEPDRTERGESSYLLTEGYGYVLRVEPSDIDAVGFEQEAAEGRALVNSDPVAASELLNRALGRWRGDALQEFVFDEFARGEIARLEELRIAAVDDRIEADLLSGRSRELVGELESLRESHPLRERPVGQLTSDFGGPRPSKLHGNTIEHHSPTHGEVSKRAGIHAPAR